MYKYINISKYMKMTEKNQNKIREFGLFFMPLNLHFE